MKRKKFILQISTLLIHSDADYRNTFLSYIEIKYADTYRSIESDIRGVTNHTSDNLKAQDEIQKQEMNG